MAVLQSRSSFLIAWRAKITDGKLQDLRRLNLRFTPVHENFFDTMPQAKPPALSPSLELTAWLIELAKDLLANHRLAQKKMHKKLSKIEKEKILSQAARLSAPFQANMTFARNASIRLGLKELEAYLEKLNEFLDPSIQARTPDIEYWRTVHRMRENALLNGLPTPETQHLIQWMEALSNCNPLGFICAQMAQEFVLTWITQFDSDDFLYQQDLPKNFELRFERNRMEWAEFDRVLSPLGDQWNSAELKRVIDYQFRQFGASWSELLDEADPGIPRIS